MFNPCSVVVRPGQSPSDGPIGSIGNLAKFARPAPPPPAPQRAGMEPLPQRPLSASHLFNRTMQHVPGTPVTASAANSAATGMVPPPRVNSTPAGMLLHKIASGEKVPVPQLGRGMGPGQTLALPTAALSASDAAMERARAFMLANPRKAPEPTIDDRSASVPSLSLSCDHSYFQKRESFQANSTLHCTSVDILLL